MKKEQIIKLLKVMLVATAIMLVCEIIFSIPQITDFFKNLILNSNGIVVYIIIWIIMFLQVTILNIPAYVILSASISVGINTLGLPYILTVISAYIVGCLLAYWLGRKFGVRAVRWCAGSEEDFNKWCKFINEKGKIWYFLTILLPIFPDDILCIVAGSVKLNFVFYTLANLIGRTIGLITMLYTLKLINFAGGGVPLMLIAWAVALLVEFIILLVLKHKKKND